MTDHPVLPVPTPEDVLRALAAGRPGDLSTGFRAPRTWQRMRESAVGNRALRAVAERARVWADTPVEPLPLSLYRQYARDGARAPYQDIYFRARRNRLTDLALTAMADPEADLGPLEDLLWALCDEYSWCLPAHLDGLLEARPAVPHAEQVDLFAAETAFTLAELRRLLDGRLAPLVAERIRTEVGRRVLRPMLDRPAPWWETAETNWSAVCAGSVGMAALYLWDGDHGTEFPDRPSADRALAELTTRMIASMRCFLSGYGDDGACPEGLAYWSYGFGFFAAYADGLHRRTAGAIDLFEDPTGRIERIARFPGRMFLSGTATAAFSDTPTHSRLDPGLAAWLHHRFPSVPRPTADRLETEPVNSMGSWATALRSLFWAHERPLRPGPADHDEGGFLAHVQWMIARTESAGRQVGFAAKAGHNDELHNHNDLGSFVLAVDGEPLLAELGRGRYSAQYFGSGRYEILCTGSQGHSVPLVAGRTQRPGRNACAEVLDATHTPQRTAFRIDLTRAYAAPELHSLVRGFTFTNGELTVRDRMSARTAVELTERFVSFAPITVDAPGTALIRGDSAALRLRYDADAWRTEILEHTHTHHDGTTATVYSLDLTRHAAESELTLHVRPEDLPA